MKINDPGSGEDMSTEQSEQTNEKPTSERYNDNQVILPALGEQNLKRSHKGTYCRKSVHFLTIQPSGFTPETESSESDGAAVPLKYLIAAQTTFGTNLRPNRTEQNIHQNKHSVRPASFRSDPEPNSHRKIQNVKVQQRT